MTSVNTAKTRSFPGADIGNDKFSDDVFSATFKEDKNAGSILRSSKTLKLQMPSKQ